MTKKELMGISETYGFEIVRHYITREAFCIRLETKIDIPELDALVDDSCKRNITVTKEYGVYYSANGTHLYTVYCPTSWFDLWGWK